MLGKYYPVFDGEIFDTVFLGPNTTAAQLGADDLLRSVPGMDDDLLAMGFAFNWDGSTATVGTFYRDAQAIIDAGYVAVRDGGGNIVGAIPPYPDENRPDPASAMSLERFPAGAVVLQSDIDATLLHGYQPVTPDDLSRPSREAVFLAALTDPSAAKFWARGVIPGLSADEAVIADVYQYLDPADFDVLPAPPPVLGTFGNMPAEWSAGVGNPDGTPTSFNVDFGPNDAADRGAWILASELGVSGPGILSFDLTYALETSDGTNPEIKFGYQEIPEGAIAVGDTFSAPGVRLSNLLVPGFNADSRVVIFVSGGDPSTDNNRATFGITPQ